MQDFVNGRCGWCGTDELYVKYHDTTICYAHLQASGFINDHLADCICRKDK